MGAWEFIYDRYSASMYGVIVKLTDNKKASEEILTMVFLELQNQKDFLKTDQSLCAILLRYTYKFAITHLKEEDRKKQIPGNDNPNIIELLTTKCNSLDDVAKLLDITKDEAKTKLREAFLALRQDINQQAFELIQ
ncbi:MAG: hypothetical protein ABIT58_05270 [Ferruginibacter sp.]